MTDVPVRVGAVIVSYHPHLPSLRRMLAALVPQVETVFIVDNGSQETIPQLRAMVSQGVSKAVVELIELGGNLGIAAAHNAGLRQGFAQNLEAMLLFDQDSVPAPDLVEQLLRAWRQLHAQGQRVAALGPQWVDERSGRRGSFYRVQDGRIRPMQPPADAGPIEVDFLISSGTLILAAAIQDVGSMREDLFIDHVDTEWCLRARMAGWSLFGVPCAMIGHALGDASKRVWLGRWREVALHSPDRNYYEVRNTLMLMRMSGISVNWRIAHAIRLLQVIVFYGALVPPRGLRLRRIARALLDGWRGRGGPIR
jgi:rhamnosyltransferase